MAISLSSLKRAAAPKPPIALVYGVGGVGKTTLAADAPNPVFLCIEDGLTVDRPHWTPDQLRTFDDVMAALGTLYTEAHDFRTLVVDSVDWLEPIVWAAACRANGWANIEQPGYGKGYAAAVDIWRQYLDGLNALRNERGMTVLQIAHSDIKRFDSPEHEPYDRYQIKLHRGSSALLIEHADLVAFLNYRVSTVKSDAGFNKKVVRGVGGGDRVLYTAERPAFIAKNRYPAMPDVIPLPDGNPWSAVAPFIPALSTAKEAA
jgi:hypothetical protein